MAKIDKIIDNAIEELQEKEIELIELDNKIKEIFKTKKSAFNKIEDWIINTSNGIVITYRFEVQSRYPIFVTFKISEGKNDQLIRDVKVKVLKITRL